MRILLSVILSMTVSGAATVRAAGPADTSAVALTLSECIAMAVDNNKEVAAASRAVENAMYTARSRRADFMPDISAVGTGLYSTADGSADIMGYGVGYKVGTVMVGGLQLQQPLYTGGKINAAWQMASIARDIAEAQERLTLTEVIEQTDEAYARVVMAEGMTRVAEAYRSQLDELLRTVESAWRHGMKPKNDVLKVQVKLNESLLSLRKAENALRLSKMSLCHYIGLPLTTDIVLTGALDDDTCLVAADISRRPEYAILDKQVELARREIKLDRADMLPQVGLSAAYDYIHGIEINDRTVMDKGLFSVMLTVSVPLFHFGGRSDKVKAARARMEEARLQQQDMNEKMMLELAQAADNVDEAVLECDIARRSMSQAEENMRVSRRMYEAGMETLADHLEAQSLWQQACEQTVSADYRLHTARTAYLKAAGRMDPADYK